VQETRRGPGGRPRGRSRGGDRDGDRRDERDRRSRAGVTLVEVLVAAVLLGIGVAGTLSALATSVRFRSMALTRESIAAAGHRRLTWLEAVGCATNDTTVLSPAGAQVTERWELRRAGNVVALDGMLEASHAAHRLRTDVRASWPCG
jgi:prepilin-type N-terminal cleavage/methylation domain-containing protein